MPALNFYFTQINAKKDKETELKTNLKVSHGLKLLDIKKIERENKESDLVKVYFEYDVTYESIAEFLLKGYLIFADKKDVIEEILSTYKKKKQLPLELKLSIYNNALYAFTLKSLELSKELNLPPHIQLPSIQEKN